MGWWEDVKPWAIGLGTGMLTGNPLLGVMAGGAAGSGILKGVADPATAYRKELEGRAGAPEASIDNGGLLDTRQVDEDRQRQARLIAQLQQQAMTGDPVALAQLQQSTNQTVGGAQALGQTASLQHGLGAGAAARDIGDQQAHAQQVGVGQADILKNYTQQQAQQQLQGLLGQTRSTDIDTATSRQGGLQQLGGADAASRDVADEQFRQGSMGVLNGVIGGIFGGGAHKSQGGLIDGSARVRGDSLMNDSVPSMLSPGEIVLPRSIAQSPDAPRQAASFVEAVRAGRGPKPQYFDNGGVAGTGPGNHGLLGPIDPWLQKTFPGPYHGVKDTIESIGRSAGLGPVHKVPYVPMDTRDADRIRDSQVMLGGQLESAGYGQGPSTVAGHLQQGTDANILRAMQAQAMAGDSRSALGQIGSGTAAGQQHLADEAAQARAGEIAQAQTTNAALVDQMRRQSLHQAQIQQRARLDSTLTNMGLDAAHRAQLLGSAGALGTGLTSMASNGMFRGSQAPASSWQGGGSYGSDMAVAGDFGSGSGGAPASMPTDWGDSGQAYAAHGGMVSGESAEDDAMAKEFLRAIRKRKKAS